MLIHGSASPENTKWGRTAEVTDGFLHVTGSIVSMPPISVGSVSISAGSTAYIYGKSGTGFYPLLSTSGTDGGLLRVDSSVSVSTGSESYIKGGSIQTYNPLGSTFILGSVYATGSINIATNLASIGSYTTQNVNVYPGETIGVSGIVEVSNRIAGSIVNWPGSLAISNFSALGSKVVIDAPETIGSYSIQTIIGSVAITDMPAVNVTTGSEVYIKGGSIQTYTPLGSTFVLGSIYVTGSININTNLTQIGSFGAGRAISGIVNQGTSPWIIAGSVYQTGSINIATNLATIGSYPVQGVSGIVNLGNNWTGVGSVYQVNSSSATITGSLEVFSNTGSVQIYGALSATAGSEQYIKTGSISLLNSLGSTLMFGSVVITSPISVSTGSEQYIKGGSIQTYSPLGSTFVLGSVYATGSINISTNLATIGSHAGVVPISGIVNLGTVWTGAGSVYVVNTLTSAIAGSIEVFSSTGSVEVYGALSASAGSEQYIKGGSIQTYSPLGSTFILGSVYATGSINIATDLTTIGSYTRYIGSNTWVNGSVYATGSINIATSLSSIGSFSAGKAISGIVNQGTNPWIILGSVEVTAMPAVSVTTGSEVYIKGGSIHLYSGTTYVNIPDRIAGSIVNMPIVGISGTVIGVSGIVNQGTNPWVVSGTATINNRVAGSIVDWPGSVAISNFAALGSQIVVAAGSVKILSNNGSIPVWMIAGSIQTYSPIGVGSVTGQVTIGAGSIQTYNPIGVGSVIIQNARYDLGSFLLIAGSISSMPTVSVTTGSESYIKGGSIHLYSGTTYTDIPNRVAGSIVNMPIVEVSGTGFTLLGSGRVILNSLSLLAGSINIISGTSTTIITGGAGSYINLYAYKLVNRDTGSVLVKWQNQVTDIEGPQSYAVNGGVVESVSPPYYIIKTGNGSNLSLSSTGSIGGRISYFWSI